MAESEIEKGLPHAWTKPRTKARIHILRAHDASKAVIIRRKPSRYAHIISWKTDTDELDYGSWFKGRIYAERCDLSWDGSWMVYLALSARGKTWNGICKPPLLRTVVDVPHDGTWAGGGCFTDESLLMSNDVWYSDRSLSEFSNSPDIPFSIERLESGGEVFPILSCRLERDGWKREGAFTEDKEISLKHSLYSTLCLDDPGWSWRPTAEHPVLRMFYRGYLVHGYTFEFKLDDSSILDPQVDWATWDAKGDLLVAREGAIERYSLDALRRGTPDFLMNLESLTPPPRGAEKQEEG